MEALLYTQRACFATHPDELQLRMAPRACVKSLNTTFRFALSTAPRLQIAQRQHQFTHEITACVEGWAYSDPTQGRLQ